MSDNGQRSSTSSDRRDVLSEIDVQEAMERGEDRVCIVRNHESGDISWRFATPQADPLGMLMRVFWHQMLVESGYRARIEALENIVRDLGILLQAQDARGPHELEDNNAGQE